MFFGRNTKITPQTGKQRGEHTDLNTEGRAGSPDTGETNEGGADNRNWQVKNKDRKCKTR